MSTLATATASDRPAGARGLREALRGAIEHATWRVVAATLLVAGALAAWSLIDSALGTAPQPPFAEVVASAAVVNLIVAVCIMFAVLVADQRVAAGSKRLPAYACAVAVGSALGALAQWQMHDWLQLSPISHFAGMPDDVTVMQPAFVFLEYLMWGSIIVWIYVNRRSALRAAARMSAAHVQRTRMQRATLQSRLQALQARVEPQFLFNTLARVRELYECEPAKGKEMLGNLIVYLRAALPQLREPASTLGQELDLASAYVDVVRPNLAVPVAVRIDAAETVRAACMPPLVMLPLIEHMLLRRQSATAAPAAVDIVARSTGSRLRIDISCSGQASGVGAAADDLRDVRERLQMLYGDAGTLACHPADARGVHTIIEIPHEATDGRHR